MKKKVLFVINTLSRAGAETAMLALLRTLLREPVEIYVYVVLGQGELRRELPEEVTVLNRSYSDTSVLSEKGRRYLKKTVLRSFFHHGRWLQKTAYIIKNAVDMAKCKRVMPDKLLWRMLSDGGEMMSLQYDLAVAYLEGGAAYYTADHVNAKKKAAFIHISYTKAGYNKKLDLDCYAAFDRIFAVSDEVRDDFLAVYPQWSDKTKVFHNIIDRAHILEYAKKAGGFSDHYDGIRLLTVGRLTHQKAYDIAVCAMKKIKDAGINARWYVLGEGEERERLTKQIRELSLEQEFILCGAVENPYPYYRQCDIYIHATRFEGKSIAIQEAQCLCRPIIASDCPGNREQIKTGEDGILCSLSPDGIYEAAAGLIADAEKRKRLGDAAGKRQLFHPDELQMLLELLT